MSTVIANQSKRPKIKIPGLPSKFIEAFFFPKIQIHVLPGGTMPVRKTEGAIGFDAYARAIVSATEMEEGNPLLRKTLFDFKNRPKNDLNQQVFVGEDRKFCYRLIPGERVTIGVGFVTSMPFPLKYWMAPRSGLASRYGISIANSPGTVDPDYRGEAGATVHNHGKAPFDIYGDMRIVQIVFSWTPIPDLIEVETHEELLGTTRGTGGFGSTGLR
jgi:dUTP pyrophosphatase